MACIKIIDSIKINIYKRDHNPPHFHAIIAEYEELIIIESLSTYSGNLPKTYRKKVIEWAENNKDFIMTNWNLLNGKK